MLTTLLIALSALILAVIGRVVIDPLGHEHLQQREHPLMRSSLRHPPAA